MDALVGYTGFVGSNLAVSHKFDFSFNTKNIADSYGLRPDLLVYAGVTGTKFIANAFPANDKEIIDSAIQNIKKINAKKTILISTVDIYDSFCYSEDHFPERSRFFTYGNNRLFLENWVMENLSDYHIIRIPALYGLNLKKNFIFDLISVIPVMLSVDKYQTISKELEIQYVYTLGKDGLYHFSCSDRRKIKRLRKEFLSYGFNAMFFTDSRSEYQFYSLIRLWEHICIAIEKNIKVLNLVTEPVKASVLFEKIYHKEFINEVKNEPIMYNVLTKYDELFCGSNGYICSKEVILKDLINFINLQIRALA